MAPFPIFCQGKTWKTAEHLFQALRFHENEKVQEEIRAERSPMSAKMKAKAHASEMTVEPMSAQDLDNMEFVLRLKIEQHPSLKEQLIATGDEPIVEDVTARSGKERAAFWGAARRDDGTWFGQNMLGMLWMKIRQELRDESWVVSAVTRLTTENHCSDQAAGTNHHVA
jgi:ribA/ribD-fused uncharacterized protein